MLVLEVMVGDVMVMIEIMIEGEINHLALGCVRGGGICLGFAEEGEDDLELFWGEDFAGAGVAGGLEGGHEWFVGMDFVGEAFARTLLTFGDVA